MKTTNHKNSKTKIFCFQNKAEERGDEHDDDDEHDAGMALAGGNKGMIG